MSAKKRKFVPVTAADVTDDALLPGLLRRLTVEVKDSFKRIGEHLELKIEPKLDVIQHAIADLASRMTHLEDYVHKIDDRVRALERNGHRPRRNTQKE